MNPRSCSRTAHNSYSSGLAVDKRWLVHAHVNFIQWQSERWPNGGWYTHTSITFSGRVRDDPPWAVNAALHFGDTPQLGTEKHGVLSFDLQLHWKMVAVTNVSVVRRVAARDQAVSACTVFFANAASQAHCSTAWCVDQRA
jgi:hypothetical protein